MEYRIPQADHPQLWLAHLSAVFATSWFMTPIYVHTFCTGNIHSLKLGTGYCPYGNIIYQHTSSTILFFLFAHATSKNFQAIIQQISQ